MAKKAYGEKAFVGGNIGDPLLNYVDEMTPDSLAILEISSFQLEQMTISPDVAAILNITPNHLDRHGTMAAYTAAKRRILEFQRADSTAILNRDDNGSWDLREDVHGRLVSFGVGCVLQATRMALSWQMTACTYASTKRKFRCCGATKSSCAVRIM